MGYEGRSNNNDIFAKEVEVLKKKGEYKETRENHNEEALWKELYTSEFTRLRREYPDKNEQGEDVDDEWYESKAIEYADAMLKLKKRMQE
ncbi:TPA: hypothetical protein DEP58_02270 [Patescibacteria group bacterium]|nr:MAG: hypothetical protein UU98_C0009G0004 [Parcubacteria group bacterium GW2011_GWD2_42_14]HCC05110.1 hypothetical protein [Patescibacteria group bacterium]